MGPNSPNDSNPIWMNYVAIRPYFSRASVTATCSCLLLDCYNPEFRDQSLNVIARVGHAHGVVSKDKNKTWGRNTRSKTLNQRKKKNSGGS